MLLHLQNNDYQKNNVMVAHIRLFVESKLLSRKEIPVPMDVVYGHGAVGVVVKTDEMEMLSDDSQGIH